METPSDRLSHVHERIAKAAQRSGRSAGDITLMAVTKTVSFERALPFIQAGVTHLGENRVQEALTKYSTVAAATENPGEGLSRPSFHLIGPLQTNKAKKAVAFFDVIQSLDRWSLAVDLDRHAAEAGKVQDCLVQIKISDEPSKSGLAPEALIEFLQQLNTLPHLAVRGMMGIPPLSAVGDASRPYFQKLRRLRENLPSATRSTLQTLSMGMSSDFEIAIEEGSTMVRLGTALFGPR